MSSLAPRRAALRMISGVLDEGRMLFEANAALRDLGPADRARAERLAQGVLRHLGRCDTLLMEHLSKAPPEAVLHILRLATYEICADGSASHGVVYDAVQIAGRHRNTLRLKGLVNAVLRKVAKQGPEAWAKLTPSELPDWLRARLMKVYGKAAVAAMEAAHSFAPPTDFTVRDEFELPNADVLPTGQVRLARPGQISALPGYTEGKWWVQDASAALPVQMLSVVPGETVLDLCAAPGGKTLQFAAAGAKVTADDVSERRMSRVEENLKRMNLKANVQVADARAVRGTFKTVLLDAPCSATGTLRRNPDLAYAKMDLDLRELTELQRVLLAHAAKLGAADGRLLYCTCSLLPEEGEAQVRAFLAKNPGWRTDPSIFQHPGVDPAWLTEEGGIRLRPDYWAEFGGMDGFYIALLEKTQPA